MQKHNDKIEYSLRELRGLTLADSTRARMRAELSEYADFHAARKHVPIKSPFVWLSMTMWYRTGAALTAVLLLAGGTAYASGDSLPGSPLYTVKVNFKEPIEVALATTPKQKADKHTKLAEKRLEEATKLAVSETLNADTQVYLEQEFSEHVDSTLAAAETLEKNGENGESLDVRSHLEASLEAHADILDLVEDRLEETGEEDRPAHALTKNLIRAVELRREVVSETRIALERDLEDGATQSDTLAIVTETAGSVSAEAKATILPTVVEHIANTDEALEDAKKSLEREDPEDIKRAFRKAHEAERSSDIVSTLLKNADILIQVDTATDTSETATTTETLPTPTPERRSWWQ